MRMKILKIVVVLLIAGSGDARPQKADLEDPTKAETTTTSNEGWKPTSASNESRDAVREDSRYTRNSGSNRTPYIPYFRGDRGAKLESPSRVFSPNATKRFASETRPFFPLDGNGPLVSPPPRDTTRKGRTVRRPKIDKQWTEPQRGFTLIEDDVSRKLDGFADLLAMKGGQSNVSEESGSVVDRPRESLVSNTSRILKDSASMAMISGRGLGDIIDNSRGGHAFIENSPKRIGEDLDVSSEVIGNSRPRVSFNDHRQISMSSDPVVSESFGGATANRSSEILVQNSKSRNAFRKVSPASIETLAALNVFPSIKNSTDAFDRYRETLISNEPVIVDRETTSSRRSEILLRNPESLNNFRQVFPSRRRSSMTLDVFPNIENSTDPLDDYRKIPAFNNPVIFEERTTSMGLKNPEPESTFGQVSDPRILKSASPTVSLKIIKNSDNVRSKISRRASNKNVLNNSGRISTITGLALNQKSQPQNSIDHRIGTMQLVKNSTNIKFKTPQSSSTRLASIVKHVSNVTKDFSEFAMKGQVESAASKLQNTSEKSSQENLVVNRNIKQGNITRFPPSSLVHMSKAQKNKSRDKNNTLGQQSAAVQNIYFKNWPNEALQDLEDLYNYEKYTSFNDRGNQSSELQNPQEPSVLSSKEVLHRRPTADSSVQEIVHWLKIPAFTANQSHFVEDEKVDDLSSVFAPVYHDLEPNLPLLSSDAPNFVHTSNSQNDFDDHQIDDWQVSRPQSNPTSSGSSNYHVSPNLPFPTNENIYNKGDKLSYNPTTQVKQDTVVQIFNIGTKKGNVTTTETLSSAANDVVNNKTSSSSSSPSSQSAQVPNVHIAFTSEEVEGKNPTVQKPSLATFDQNCPTIMINSYTRINSTIQGKEGCTDLNIIINSHLFNANIYKPSVEEPSQSQDQLVDASDKYVNGAQDYTQSSPVYQSIPSEVPQNDYYQSPSNTYNPSGIPQNDYQGPQKGPEDSVQGTPSSSTFEVFQGTQISLTSSSFSNDEQSSPLGSGSPLEESPVGSSIGESDSSNGAEEALIGASNVDNPAASNPTSPIQTGGGSSLLSEPGAVMGQANDAVGSSSLQLPGISNLPAAPGLPNLPGLLNRPGSSNRPGGSSSPSDSSGLVSSSQDEDDDDDDLDLSPGGLMQSIGSIFTYLTFLNPLNYGFVSLAAAPFAAIAAGLLSLVAFFIPWAMPTMFDFGRAADRVTIRFRPSVEEIVRRSVHKYDRWNDWKSKRKKR